MATLWSDQQKRRGDKLILGWFRPRACWKKYRKGATKYFHQPNSKAGYEAALLEFQAWCRQQDGLEPWVAEYRHHQELFQRCLGWYDRFGVPDGESGVQEQLAAFVKRIEVALAEPTSLGCLGFLMPDGRNRDEKAIIIELSSTDYKWADDHYLTYSEAVRMGQRGFGCLGYELPAKWKERLRHLEFLGDASSKKPQTVGYWIARYLDFKADQARGGELAPKTLKDRGQKLGIFESWIKPGTHVATINQATVRDFYRHLLRQKYEKVTKEDYFSAFRMWTKWAWRHEACELDNLPKNLDDRELRFTSHTDSTGRKRTRTEQLWTPAEIKKALKLPQPWRCWLVLMANCGFTQADLNELRHDELRLREGRIVRQRTKTRRCPDPPIVSYKLWDTTIKLLKPQISDDPVYVLRTKRGARLLKRQIDEEGKVKIHDNVSRCWQKVRKRNGLDGKVLKFLRKTGSTKIRRNPDHKTMDALYLGESWKNIPDRHYNAFDGEPYPPLDEAIQWLGEELKLTGTRSRSRTKTRVRRPQQQRVRRRTAVPSTGKPF